MTTLGIFFFNKTNFILCVLFKDDTHTIFSENAGYLQRNTYIDDISTNLYFICFVFFLKYISFVFSKTVLNLTFITTTKQSLPNYLPTIYFFYLFIILFIICQFNLVFEPIASFLGGTKLQPSEILL